MCIAKKTNYLKNEYITQEFYYEIYIPLMSLYDQISHAKCMFIFWKNDQLCKIKYNQYYLILWHIK